MPLTMSQLTVPAFVQALDALSGVLEKAERHAADRKIDEGALLQARVFPDMFPFVWQVRTACDFAKGTTARLSGGEIPSFADDETSFAQLRGRIAKTVDYIKGVPSAAIDGSEDREVSIGTGERMMRFRGEDYLLSFALPNFYFHGATAYGLLRHSGIEIGKRDFIGAARRL